MQLIRSLLICLFFCSYSLTAQVPTVSDCLGAISVCTDLYIENESPVGAGNYTSEFTGDNCVSIEQNSVWYLFTVQEDGDFGFVLTPNDISDDYDWALFNLTGKTCQDLVDDPDLIASCNAAGGGTCNGLTGATGNSIYSFQNFGCGNLPPTPNGGGFSAENDLITVEQGETFALCIINWTGSQNGYTLDFGLSQVDIFDGLEPQISAISLPATNSCTVESFPISLSEYITCNSAQVSDITIDGPGGPFIVKLEGENCENGGDFEKEFEVIIDPPLQAPGAFTIRFDGELQDLCGNNIEPIEFLFTLDEFTSTGERILLDSICEGEAVLLSPNSDDISDFSWFNGSKQSEILVEAAGLYTVELRGDCIFRVDTFEVSSFPNPSIVDVTLVPSACNSASGQIQVNNVEGSAPFQYSLDDMPFTDSSTFEELGLGIHKLTVSDKNGCLSSEVYEIDQATSASIEGVTIYEVIFPDQAIFQPVIIGDYISLNWSDPDNKLSCTDCLNPFASSPTDAVFELEVEDSFGCLHYKNFYLRVTVDRDFYAPTIFTPNGDQINDVFFLGSGPEVVEILSLSVYNRWGEELFRAESISPNDPEEGWDGTKLGRPMQPGVYPWKAILKYVDGFTQEYRGALTITQ